MKTRDIVIGGLLTAVAIMIPVLFAGTPLMINIPPYFTATIAAHVPILIAMAISPGVAIMVGLGSGIGFLLKTGAVVGARAFTHMVFGGIGAYFYKKGMPFMLVLLLTAPIHGLFEVLIVLPFGIDLRVALLTYGLGTVIHHLVDSVITVVIYQALLKFSLLKKPNIRCGA